MGDAGNVGDAGTGASKIDAVGAGTSAGAVPVAGGTPSTAEEFTRETLAAKEMADNPQETYADLKARATKAEEKLKELQSVSGETSGRWRRRRWESDAAATASVNDIPEMPSSSTGVLPSSGVLANALAPGGSGTASSELATVAVQTAPLTIQLLIPLLMLLVLFGFFSLIAYALDFTGRRGGPPGGGSGGRAGHRRMPSGEAPLTDVDAARLSDWSPRRGFAYSSRVSSWNTKLNEAPSSSASRSSGGSSGFALPASYMPGEACGFSPELEQRRGSPGRTIEERRASAVGLNVV